jgi:hypothetical protein
VEVHLRGERDNLSTELEKQRIKAELKIQQLEGYLAQQKQQLDAMNMQLE